jgi:hypothetical protein
MFGRSRIVVVCAGRKGPQNLLRVHIFPTSTGTVYNSHQPTTRMIMKLLVLLLSATTVAATTSLRTPIPSTNVTVTATNVTEERVVALPLEKPVEVDESQPVVLKKQGLDLNANPDCSMVSLSWYGPPDTTYKLCWKLSSKIGDPCLFYQSVDVNAVIGTNWFSGYVHAGLSGLQANTAYTVKVRKSLFSSATVTFTTDTCGCAVPCPYGGWYDGANCLVGQAPVGSTAFIYAGNYYYSPLPMGTTCPYAGSWYDGANCYVDNVPTGAAGFIWLNHWYYKACP